MRWSEQDKEQLLISWGQEQLTQRRGPCEVRPTPRVAPVPAMGASTQCTCACWPPQEKHVYGGVFYLLYLLRPGSYIAIATVIVRAVITLRINS